MPVLVVRRGNKYRIVETDTGKLARNRYNSVADGGGHDSQANAQSQARCINLARQSKQIPA